MGRRRGVAPPARPGSGRRPDLLADADALRHAGLLPLHGEAAAQAEEGRADLRRSDRGSRVRAGARGARGRVSAVAARPDDIDIIWQNAVVLLLFAATVLAAQADLSIDNYALSSARPAGPIGYFISI